MNKKNLLIVMLMSSAIGIGVFSSSKDISVSAYDAEEFSDAIKIGDSYTANSQFTVTNSYVEFSYFDLLVPDTGYRQTLFLNGAGILGNWSNKFSGLVSFDFDIDTSDDTIYYSYYLNLPISYKLSNNVFVLPINDFYFINHIKVRFYLTIPFSQSQKADLQENIHEDYFNLYSGVPNVEPFGLDYQDGYDRGFDDGVSYGYDSGFDDGVSYGYTSGYYDGVENTELSGTLIGNVIFSTIGSLASFIVTVSSFEVMGLSIGSMVAFLISVGLILLILGMVKK